MTIAQLLDKALAMDDETSLLELYQVKKDLKQVSELVTTEATIDKWFEAMSHIDGLLASTGTLMEGHGHVTRLV